MSRYRPKVYLLNDTSREHVGSKAASYVIKSAIRKNYRLYAKHFTNTPVDYDILKASNIVVINGEGTMHHDTSRSIILMTAIRRAIKMNKQVHLVNTVWQDMHRKWTRILNKVDSIVVREPRSKAALEDIGVNNVEIYPDICVGLKAKKVKPQINFRGKVVVGDSVRKFNDMPLKDDRVFRRTPNYNIPRDNWAHFIAVLKTIGVYVTGRHHGIYACCAAKTPFVAFKSNTHKMEGLLEWAGSSIPILDNPKDAPSAIRWAKDNQEEYDKLFKWMRSLQKWPGFDDTRARRNNNSGSGG